MCIFSTQVHHNTNSGDHDYCCLIMCNTYRDYVH